jgi:hypothetical protein
MKTRYKIFFVLGGISLFLIFLGSCTKKSASNSVLHVDQNFNFPPGFPPDPGEAGKKTLQGIDSDHDGLRDDVQRWIYARYPGDEKKRKALRQMTLSIQEDLNPDLKDEDLEAADWREEKAVKCLQEIFDTGTYKFEDYTELQYLQAKVLNTAARTLQSFQTDGRYDGKSLGPTYPDDGTACE